MTIFIDKDTSNTCFFTLNESTTITGVRYILEIESKATNQSKIMWLNDDVSTNVERYNKYIIQEVPEIDEDLEDQKINLIIGGHNFYVWQTESDILDISFAQNIIESGWIHVNGVEPVINVAPVTPNTKFVYKN